MGEVKSFESAFRALISVLLLIGGILVCMSLSMTDTDSRNNLETMNKNPQEVKRMENTGSEFWRSINLLEPKIPKVVTDKAKDVKVESKRISIMGIDSFYRVANQPVGTAASGLTILLLHGAAFSSKTWQDLGTISLLSAMGHHVVAIDLPGYGETKSVSSVDKVSYLKSVISSLQLRNVVIVSPSMSGGFSIPFLIEYSKEIIGYIPVAPVQSELVKNIASNINTPTLIIYGELDTGLGYVSRDNLQNLPNSQVIKLLNAKHPAYLDQPKMFHTLIFNFMNQLEKN